MRIIHALSRTSLMGLWVLGACAPQQPAFDSAAVRTTIESTNAKRAAAFVAGDYATATSYYTDKTMVCAPHTPLLRGRDEFLKFMNSLGPMSVKITDMKFTTVSVGGSGDVAYEVRTYTLLIMFGMKAESDTGKYVTVWNRQADGSWKIAADAWNTSQPQMMIPPAEPEKKPKK